MSSKLIGSVIYFCEGHVIALTSKAFCIWGFSNLLLKQLVYAFIISKWYCCIIPLTRYLISTNPLVFAVSLGR